MRKLTDREKGMIAGFIISTIILTLFQFSAGCVSISENVTVEQPVSDMNKTRFVEEYNQTVGWHTIHIIRDVETNDLLYVTDSGGIAIDEQ